MEVGAAKPGAGMESRWTPRVSSSRNQIPVKGFAECGGMLLLLLLFLA